MLEERRGELRDELDQIEQALNDLGRRGRQQGRRSRSAGRKPTSRQSRGQGKRRGRAEQALAHVQSHPGATAAEISKAMKIKPNYVYRLMSQLAKDGKVTKSGRGYLPSA